MFQSRAQILRVVYLCYQLWLFCISHPRSGSNIINQTRKRHGLIRWHCDGKKKSLNHFLKRSGLNGLYHCVTKWSRLAIFVIHGPARCAALQTIPGCFYSHFKHGWRLFHREAEIPRLIYTTVQRTHIKLRRLVNIDEKKMMVHIYKGLFYHFKAIKWISILELFHLESFVVGFTFVSIF